MRALLTAVGATGALLVGAGGALANSVAATVTTADGRPDAVAYIPRVFTISGSTTGPEYLYVKHRAAGGAPCAASAFTDPGTWVDAAFFNAPVNGAFTIQRVLTWRMPGAWMFCYWLAPGEVSPTTPIAQTMSVRTPAASVAAQVTPSPVNAGDRTTIAVTGTSEAPRRVYAKLRLDDGTPCAPTFAADPGGSMIDGWSIDGSFRIKAYDNDPALGRYLVCMWLAGSSDDPAPVAGPVAQTFDVTSARRVVLSSAEAVNCRTRRASRSFVARRVRSVCVRVRFATPPARGERFSVSYLAPGRKRRTYKTVQAKWPGGSARTITSAPLPARAYRQRRGRWRAVLKVDGRQMSLVAFRVR